MKRLTPFLVTGLILLAAGMVFLFTGFFRSWVPFNVSSTATHAVVFTNTPEPSLTSTHTPTITQTASPTVTPSVTESFTPTLPVIIITPRSGG